MAQHSYSIPNQSGASFRSDLNNALSAIVSQNSGASAPTTTYAYQFWADTTNGLLKQRDAANAAWVTIGTLGSANLGLASLAGATFTGNTTVQTNNFPGVILNSTAVGSWKSAFRFQNSGAAKFEIGVDLNSAGANNFYIWDSVAATSRMVIDSSGRLLVGTSSTSSVSNTVFQGRSNSTTGGALLTIARGSNNPATNEELGLIYFADSSHNGAAIIDARRDAGTWTSGTSMPTRLAFSTTADGASSPTEAMRLDSSGRLLVATTSTAAVAGVGSIHRMRSSTASTWALITENNSATPFGTCIYYSGAAPNTTGSQFLYCSDTGALRLEIRSNGGIANYSANNVNLSDRNVKKDIAPAADTWDCLKEWEIVNFRYKDQADNADLNMGVIAQQVAESCPEVITVFQEAKEAKEAVLDEEGNELEPAQEAQPEKLGVKDQQMMWMAIKALQEAQVRIEELEAKVAALEAA